MHYLISYDLVGPERNYPHLLEELRKFGAVRVLASQWTFTRYQTDAKGLVGHFRRFIDADDRLLITELNDNVGAYNLLNRTAA